MSNATGGASIDPERGTSILRILSKAARRAFRIVIDWQDFDGKKNTGPGRAVALSDQTGLCWFFDAINFEVLVKMVDACGFSGMRWLFIASTTNVEMTIRVIDQVTGQTETYANPLGQRAEPVIDLAAFGCRARATSRTLVHGDGSGRPPFGLRGPPRGTRARLTGCSGLSNVLFDRHQSTTGRLGECSHR
ncbi:MAG: hypothetical protein AAGC60_10720 [Acidobacteriota bacterium]